MQQLAPGAFRGGPGSYNYYALVEDDEVTLIDAGCSRDWSRMTAGLESVGSSIDAVAGLIVTHVHSDHFGAAVDASASGVDVSVHEDDEVRALGDYEGRFGAEAGDLPIFSLRTWRNFLPMIMGGVMKLEFLDVVDTFSDGDALDLPGRPTVIHTPGHTEGHSMFHSGELLFTGDCLVTMDLLGSDRGPQYMQSVFDLDTEQSRASLDRIVDVDANLILPGHGEPWEGTPSRAVEIARG